MSNLINTTSSYDSLFNLKSVEQSKKLEVSHNNIRVFTPQQKKSIVRPYWHYLTLGIPILIEKVSLFCYEAVHREIMGEAVQFNFKYKFLPKAYVNQINLFHKYNEDVSSVLNSSQLHKATKMAQQLSDSLANTANTSIDNESKLDDQKKYQSIVTLINNNKNPKLSKKSMNARDWKTLDMIDYEIAKDHFSNLSDIFNTDWFKNLGFSREIKSRFQIDYQEALVAESLSITLAYVEGLEGKTLSLPYLDNQTGTYRPVIYTIKEFSLGDALPCYIFESNDPQAPPWFVIRGTRRTPKRIACLESILADTIDYKGISRKVVNKSLVYRPVKKEGNDFVQQESLSDIFNRWRKQNKKVILAGHSLGGTLANIVAIDFPNTFKVVYTFGAAGVSQKTNLRYQKIREKVHDKLINFDFEGDIIPSGGHCLIGRHLSIKAIWETNEPSIGLSDLHLRSHLNQDFQMQNIDVPKENNKFARFVFEKIRAFAGCCLRGLLYVFGRKHLPDWWKKRKVYKQQANIQRSLNFHKILKSDHQNR